MTIPAPPDLNLGPIRKRYRAEYNKTTEAGWPKGLVRVYDRDEVIYEYKRNYSFMDTFEPFRQWDGESWHNYALISPHYTSFEVLDLEKREVVAKRPYPQRPWPEGEYERMKKNLPENFEKGGPYEGKGPDDKIDGEGFCPTGFFVPDTASWDADGDGGDYGDEEPVSAEDWEDFFSDGDETSTGQIGFVSGCFWGDDSSYKVRVIDLSRISEGIVTEDERFGYISLPPGMKLRQAVSWIWPAAGRVTIAVALTFNIKDGTLGYWHEKELPKFGKRD